jgi:indolepyruvate ferredoxin oxidoreductase alpha subunit
MLEPSTPEEAKEMTRIGFDISEEVKLPLLLRTTTRLNHIRGPIELKKLQKPKRKGQFKKDPMLEPSTPEEAKEMTRIGFDISEEVKLPLLLRTTTRLNAYNYVREIVDDMKLDVKILKLGMTHPIPRKMCEDFIKSCKNIVVVEELEPILENQFKTIAYDLGSKVNIYGKSTGHFSRLYEYNIDIVADAFSKIFNINNPISKPKESKIKLPNRPPALCPGCPHRVTYYAVKKAAPKTTIYPTDIGCYTLGKAPPYEVADLLLCMGSNAGTACGLAVATDEKIVSFMGDSTFFHAGIPPIVDAVHHNHDVVICVLDNRTTAMTGHQPHPGTDFDGMGRSAKKILVEDVVKGCGVENIEMVDPNNIKETTEAFKRALEFKGPSVVVSKSPCILLENRDKRKRGEEIFVYEIDQEKCKKCKTCVERFACPAIYHGEDEMILIDDQQCNGCGNCATVCPFEAILPKEAKK